MSHEKKRAIFVFDASGKTRCTEREVAVSTYEIHDLGLCVLSIEEAKRRHTESDSDIE